MNLVRIARTLVFLSTIAFFTLGQPICKQSCKAADHNLELEALTRQYDYILYVDGSTVQNYLNYPGSALNPLDRFVVTYQKTAAAYLIRGQSLPTYQPFRYEEFWYANGKPIGLRRSQDTPMTMHEQGAIYFRFNSGSATLSNTSAAADCSMRLLVEAALKRSIVAAVVVPQNAFERTSTDLGRYNFFPLDQGTGGGAKSMTLHLISYPEGLERFFVLAAPSS